MNLDFDRMVSRSRKKVDIPFKKEFAEIMMDPEKRKTSNRLGWIGIIFALICVALVWPSCWLGITIFKLGLTNLGFFTYFVLIGNIVLICLGVLCFFIPAYMCFYGIALPIMQLIVNPKKAIGWIGLAVWLISLAGTIILAARAFILLTTGA